MVGAFNLKSSDTGGIHYHLKDGVNDPVGGVLVAYRSGCEIADNKSHLAWVWAQGLAGVRELGRFLLTELTVLCVWDLPSLQRNLVAGVLGGVRAAAWLVEVVFCLMSCP